MTPRHRPRPLTVTHLTMTLGATAFVALGISSFAGMIGFVSAVSFPDVRTSSHKNKRTPDVDANVCPEQTPDSFSHPPSPPLPLRVPHAHVVAVLSLHDRVRSQPSTARSSSSARSEG